MPQSQKTGAAASAFGHETAPKIAAALGASMLGTTSNEAIYQGRRVVIKCAGKSTSSVGVTYGMLEQLELVIAAFQHQDGSFDVYSLSAAMYAAEMRDSRSSGNEGRVGIVAKKVFVERGTRIKLVRLGSQP